MDEEESQEALEQIEYERKHGGPGQERATDPNSKVAWVESAKAEKAEMESAADRAADKAHHAAEVASGSREIADRVRCVAEEGFERAKASEKLTDEDNRFTKVTRSEIGLDTVKANNKALEEEMRVPVPAVRDKLARDETYSGAGVSIKDIYYPA